MVSRQIADVSGGRGGKKMPRKGKDLYYQIHGKLVVIDKETNPETIARVNPRGHTGTWWWCSCECGNFTYARTSDLVSGRKRSCGCLLGKNRIGKKGKALDLTGQKFGMLTPMERARKPGGKSGWLCACDCGETKIVVTTNLTSGNTTSCGCKRRKTKKPVSKRCLT